MGLTMKCAQCHDHKYDPITQKEFYQFYAFFNQSSEPGSGATNANTGPLIEAGSAICSPERVKRDAAVRIAELKRLRAVPPARIAVQRDRWETEQLASLGLLKNGRAVAKKLVLFPQDQPSWIWSAADRTAGAVSIDERSRSGGIPIMTAERECAACHCGLFKAVQVIGRIGAERIAIGREVGIEPRDAAGDAPFQVFTIPVVEARPEDLIHRQQAVEPGRCHGAGGSQSPTGIPVITPAAVGLLGVESCSGNGDPAIAGYAIATPCSRPQCQHAELSNRR